MNIEDRLWDASDIADFLKLSKKTVQNHYITQPDFPPPCDRIKRWIPREVKAWATRRH